MIPRRFGEMFRNPFARDRARAEVDDDFSHHFEAKVRDLVAAGLSEAEAHSKATHAFGDVDRWRHRGYRENKRRLLHHTRRQARIGLWEDLRTALRRIVRHPHQATLAVTVLALGLGAGATVLTVLERVLLRPLPFPDPHRVVSVSKELPDGGTPALAPRDYLDWKASQRSFTDMAATRATALTLQLDRPYTVGGLRVESSFFDVVGVQPGLGRAVLPEDDEVGAPTVAVLMFDFWRTRFGADPGILGRTLSIAGVSAEVVGVMPEGFRYFDAPFWGGPRRDIFLNDPLGSDRTWRAWGGYLWPIARLAPGVSIAEADADLDRIQGGIAEAYPDVQGGQTAHVSPLRPLVMPSMRENLLMLSGVVALLLLVVCSSVAGLLLARALGRRSELAVRAAYGASRARLARELMLEAGILTGMGAVAAIAITVVLLPHVRDLVPWDVPRLELAGVDGRVLVGVALLAGAVWVVSSFLPALQASRLDLASDLKGGAQAAIGGQGRIRAFVLVGQLTLASILISGAGALLQTYARLSATDPGLDPENVTSLHMRLPTARYTQPAGTMAEAGAVLPPEFEWLSDFNAVRTGARYIAFIDEVTDRLAAIPGVEEVAYASMPPLWGPRAYFRQLPNREAQSDQGRYRVKWVSSNYFRTLGIEVRKGRGLGPGDRAGGRRVVVVNESFARNGFGRDDPLGEILDFDESAWFPTVQAEMVGVVEDVSHDGPEEAYTMTAYVPIDQRSEFWMEEQVFWTLWTTFLIRTDPSVQPPLRALQDAVWGVDPLIAISQARTLESYRMERIAPQRFYLFLLTGFAIVAMVLAIAASFGMFAQEVQRRTREIGVRRALGATGHAAAVSVLRHSATLAAIGAGCGLIGAYWLTEVLGSQVRGVDGLGFGVQAGSVAVLIIVSLASAWLPARRASRVHPAEALRAE